MRAHFKPTETYHFTSSHPPGVKKGFIKGEALRLLRTNSSKKICEEKIKTFKWHLIERLPRESYSSNPLWSELWREKTSPPTKTERKQMNLVFCHTISTISAKPKTNPNEKMAFNRTTTITERNLQGSTPRFIQQRAFAQRKKRRLNRTWFL